MERISLNGSWRFCEAGDGEWLEGVVPGENYSDLLRLGKIADPYGGANEESVQWVGERDWIYERDFDVEKAVCTAGRAELCFEMLDTLATVTLNGEELGKTDNINRRYVFDVTNKLKIGKNTLSIYFASSVNYIAEQRALDPKPDNCNGIHGAPHIRKTQCHFGWDWGPCIPTSGIGCDCYVAAYNTAKIAEIEVKQQHSDGKVVLSLKTDCECYSGDVQIEYTVTAPDGESQAVVAGADAAVDFVIDKPQLWYTADVSDKPRQPLYTVTARVAANGGHTVTKRIGLRTVELDRNYDAFGRNFCFKVNGSPVFIKGANWIPDDALYSRTDSKKLNYLFDAVTDANMNMLRVWGGGFYESDEFYDLCDERGILVWQDFMFACAQYPFYRDDFLATVKEEVSDNVRRIRHHACLALWCGNNEIESCSGAWLNKRELIKWTKTFFHELLPEWVKKDDDVTSYIAGSPCSSEFMKGLASDTDGDVHLWSVWHGLQPLTAYRKRLSRFCSEFGLESLPDVRTIRYFAEPKDYDMASPIFMAHQKCLSGNNKIQFYISTRFRLPKRFEDLIYLSEIVQSECIRDATEHWRRHKGQCNGAIYWQLNDCWPVLSWASIDYFGRYKALQYMAKHFNAPQTVSVYLDKGLLKLCVLNDKPYAFSGNISYSLQTFDGDVLEEGELKADCASGAVNHLAEFNFKKAAKQHKNNLVFVAKLYGEDGALLASKTQLFAAEKALKLPKVQFKTDIVQKGDLFYITVTADKYARYVRLELPDGYMPFSDNYFDLAAGESITVTYPICEDYATTEQLAALTVSCANTVEPNRSAFSDFLFRTKVRLMPINIANWVVYHYL